MKTYAAVARAASAPLQLETLELDPPRAREVRVKIVASGVCHTDAIVRDQVYPTPLPAVLGHEGAGIVEAVGELVTSVKPGDHVILSAAYCGTCDQCRSGGLAYCEKMFAVDFAGCRSDGTTAYSTNGEPISSHFFGQSSFATYVNAVEEVVIPVDPDVPLEIVAPLGCGIQTGAGAVLNELAVEMGTVVVVVGTGAVGCGAIMAARVAGCRKVIAVDIHDPRLELARELGATDVVNTRTEDLTEAIQRITDGRGADYIIDTTARPELLRKAADALAVRGTLALVGAAAPGTEVTFEIGLSLIRGWTFKTVVQGSSVPQVFIPRLIGLWQEGRFPIEKLIRHYPLDDINDAFEDSKSGDVIKPVVLMP